MSAIGRRGIIAIFVCVGFACLTFGCGATTSETHSGGLSENSERLPITKSGFLGDYSQLKPGEKDRAALVYFDPTVKWSSYKAIILEPVQFWSSGDNVSREDQEVLISYFYNALRENLQKNFTLTDRPGEGVMKLQVAITDATAATPVLRSVSVIIPQARLLNRAQSLATGSYAFVGSAQVEGQVTDSMTGKRLAAAIDKRAGGMALSTAAQWKWGDAENVLNYWAQKLPQRILEAQGRESAGD